MLSRPEFIERAKQLRLLVLDVDGVMTDGGIIMDEAGGELKEFSVRDGFAIRCWQRAGHQVAVLSGRVSKVVELRCRELQIHTVMMGAADKGPAYLQILQQLAMNRHEVCVMGDDLPDLPIMNSCGLSATVADAVAEVRQSAHWVSTFPGGRGAVRDLIEKVLQAQGLWEQIVERYQSPV